MPQTKLVYPRMGGIFCHGNWQFQQKHPQNCALSENQQIKRLKIMLQKENEGWDRKCLLHSGSAKERGDRLQNGKALKATQNYTWATGKKYSIKRDIDNIKSTKLLSYGCLEGCSSWSFIFAAESQQWQLNQAVILALSQTTQPNTALRKSKF